MCQVKCNIVYVTSHLIAIASSNPPLFFLYDRHLLTDSPPLQPLRSELRLQDLVMIRATVLVRQGT